MVVLEFVIILAAPSEIREMGSILISTFGGVVIVSERMEAVEFDFALAEIV